MRVLARLAASNLVVGMLFGSDLSGIWVGQIPLRNGDLQEIAFKFSQSGRTLDGKLYGDYGSTRITEGKVNGEEVEFVVLAPEQAGNQINTSRLHFVGSLKSGELELTREREAVTNAGNKGNAQVRDNGKQTFRLKRLI